LATFRLMILFFLNRTRPSHRGIKQSAMQVKITTRKKQSDHEAAFDLRNKKGVDEFGIEWIVMQDRILKAFDHVVDRGESAAEAAFVKNLVSHISYTVLVNRK